MTAERYGMILIVSGPSGSGKSTLCDAMFREFRDLEFSVSCTTRAPRGNERDGVEYHFLTREQFEDHIRNDDFLEYADVHGNFYGTLKSEVFGRTERGVDVLLDIDVQGAMQIRQATERDPELKAVCEFVFIGPPSVEVLETRLRGRATDSEEQIRLRLDGARRELSHWRKYDYLVINDRVETAAAELEGLFRSFRLKTARRQGEMFA